MPISSLLTVYQAEGEHTSVELPVFAWPGRYSFAGIPVELPGGVPRGRDEAQQDMRREQVRGGANRSRQC